jgi:hypothetical protein
MGRWIGHKRAIDRAQIGRGPVTNCSWTMDKWNNPIFISQTGKGGLVLEEKHLPRKNHWSKKNHWLKKNTWLKKKLWPEKKYWPKKNVVLTWLTLHPLSLMLLFLMKQRTASVKR